MDVYDEGTRECEDSLAATLTVEQGAMLHYRLTKPPAEEYVLEEEAEEAERTWRDEVKSSPSRTLFGLERSETTAEVLA